ncbi:MAG: DUF1905 domain-containing protein [Dokdonella sp.]
MKPARISGVLLHGHKGAAIEVPFDPAERWSMPPVRLRTGRHGHRVSARLADIEFETEIVPRASRYFVLVDTQTCTAAGVGIGDEIDVTLQPLAVQP